MMQDQKQLRARCAHRLGGHVPFPWADTEGSVHARFERVAAAYPHAVAIDSEDGPCSYAQLDRWASQIARSLRQRLAGEPQPVAMLFEHSAAPLAALLGVLKAGHIYLGLDPADPPLRIRHIVEHSGAPIVLCNEATAAAVPGGLRLSVDDLPDAGAAEPGVVMRGDAPASLYYTSGSTGKPKGVLYTHRARLVTALRNTNGIRISPHDRLALLYPTRYAGAANNTFGALLNGACVLPFDYAAHGAARLAEWLDQQRITIYHSVPAMFRQLAAYAEPDQKFEAMRLVMLSSDSVYPNDLAIFSRLFPRGCLFANSWGVSESPLFRPAFFDHDCVPGPALAAIGCPLDDPAEEDEVLLLGQPEEIVLRSRYFAAGYWRDAAQTAERFQPDPDSADHKRYYTGDLGKRNPDGSVVHLGRRDFQVQVGGERVEIAEIEAALRERPEVRGAVVVAQRSEGGEQRLVAYVACAGEQPWEADLREHVAERLPRQMVPDRFVFCDNLRLTEAGKVDRRSLPAPSRLRPRMRTAFEAPATELEAGVAALFGEVLELDGIGARDSFFELGGKSLGAMRVVAAIRDRYGVRLEMKEFFAAPTPVAVAAAIETALADDGELRMALEEIERGNG